MGGFLVEGRVYLSHVTSLLLPGRPVKTHKVVPDDLAAVGPLDSWEKEDLELLIEESRRALDGQQSRFDRMRTTAQVVLPLSTALLVILGSGLRQIVDEPTNCTRYVMYGVWSSGTALVLLAALGAAATLSVRSDFGTILPTVVSQLTPPIRQQLARSYAQQVVVGETTIGTRITVIRDAITLLALGGVLHLALWLVRTL